MKNKGVYIFNLILLLFIIVLKFVLIDHYAKYYGIVNAIFWIISLIIFVKVVGVKRDNSVVKSNVTQVVIISTLLFILLSFLSGLFFGFLKNAYSLKPMSILKNIYSLVIMIIAEEYIRGIVNNVCVKDKKPLFILTFLYIILDVILLLGPESTSSIYSIFVFTTTLGLPIVARNVLSTYLTYQVSKIPGMILRLFYSIYIYIFPIFPNLGNYIDSVLGILIPYLIYFVSSGMIHKAMDRRVAPIRRNLWYINIPIVILLLFIVALVSGLFKYQIMAIGSGSMEPVIYRGDAIVFEKVTTEDEKNAIEEGTVIVFKHNGVYITHRITKIEMVDGTRVYQTKGDNNEKEDAFKVENDDIVGITKTKIKYIGFPTLWIQDLFNR